MIVSLVIGVALSAVSALLAPKPKQQEQKDPRNLSSADVKGRSRFAPQSGFDSLQELAVLGMTVPLIFARKGVRVNGTLLWSQMLSLGNGQQFRGMLLFSSGEIEGRPDFGSYAIGDTTLENYTNAKIALYFRQNGGRIGEGWANGYDEGTLEWLDHSDVFSVYWDKDQKWRPYFSGTRTPNTQTQFGCYAPVPNGMRFRPDFDDPVIPDGDSDTKERMREKKNKSNDKPPYRCAVTKISGGYVTYRLDGSEDSGNRFEPWGSEDIKQTGNSAREAADATLSVGNQYLCGDALVVGYSIPSSLWRPGYTKDCVFKVIETGAMETADVKGISYTSAKLTIQSVAIGTVSNNRSCDVTEIGLKSTVWGQVNGYANLNGHPGGDLIDELGEEGGSFSLGSMSKYLTRHSFFILQIRKLGDDGPWTGINGGSCYCIKGNTPQPQYNWIRISHPFGQWEFRFRPLAGVHTFKNLKDQDVWLLRPGSRVNVSMNGFDVSFDGSPLRLTDYETCNPEWIEGKPKSNRLENNMNRNDTVSDYPIVSNESKSHMDGPEHQIVYVNEQVEQDTPKYDKLAYAGIRINSSKEWSSFSNLSAFFKKGVKVDRIYAGGNAATNLMPEIAYALLTDPVIGAGNLVSERQVDKTRMATAAKFCAANDFTWDGVISEKLNLREWIYENAGFCLLDFTILGGRFSLVPSVPMNSNGKINFDGKPAIKALFTDGNIKDMKVSFLGPEERQLFKATVLWRQDRKNGFPETRTLNIRLSNAQGGSDADPEESFDMSGFCTSQEHAETFAKYALKVRKEVDHGVTFLTTPQAAMNLVPGDHFRLVSEVTHTSRFDNGSIGPDGSITAATEMNGNYSILYWEPGTTGVKSATLKASGNKTSQASLFGTVFTVQNSTTVNRVYKCETLSYSEDGLVEVAGSYEPLTSSGSLAVLNWGSNHFVMETG